MTCRGSCHKFGLIDWTDDVVECIDGSYSTTYHGKLPTHLYISTLALLHLKGPMLLMRQLSLEAESHVMTSRAGVEVTILRTGGRTER